MNGAVLIPKAEDRELPIHEVHYAILEDAGQRAAGRYYR
jgi:hypothetical protein